jgi:hypothetical protein
MPRDGNDVPDACTVCYAAYVRGTTREHVFWCSRECRVIHQKLRASKIALDAATTPETKAAAVVRFHEAFDEAEARRGPERLRPFPRRAQ